MLVMHAIGLISVVKPGWCSTLTQGGTVTDLGNDLSRDMRNVIGWAQKISCQREHKKQPAADFERKYIEYDC